VLLPTEALIRSALKTHLFAARRDE